MSHVYVIPATDKETRNPNRMSELLPACGKLVINTRMVHRARNTGAVLLVRFNPAEGRPVFDKENTAHATAAAAYELSDIDDQIARAEQNVKNKEIELKTRIQSVEDAAEAVTAAETSLNDAHQTLAELIEIHGEDNTKDDDDTTEGDDHATTDDDDTTKGDESTTKDDHDNAKIDESTTEDGSEEIVELVKIVVGELDDNNEDHWTNEGKPDVNAINSALNEGADESAEKLKITATQRNTIWDEITSAE